MTQNKEKEGMLSPYRVLDLTDEKGLFCGKLLGDLGADVIKIEPPGGDPARNIGPFYHDEPDPEKSLFWWAYNTSKRGITLDIETAEGQEIFKRLVKSADFIIESFSPGYLHKLGLGYPALEEINPRVILVSITPFGQTGPYEDYKAPDIVAWAMGGEMYPFGDGDRPPTRISHHPQSYLHAGLEAAAAAMIAHHYREMTGEGQQVDVSIQECVARQFGVYTLALWDMEKVVRPRGKGHPVHHIPAADTTEHSRRWFHPCKDGYVGWAYWYGAMAKRYNPQFVEWLDSEGMADDFIKEFDASEVDVLTLSNERSEEMDRISETADRFFITHTKAELLEGALKRGVMLYPVSTVKEIYEDAHRMHLDAREFWTEIEHPELGTTITYPGAFAHSSGKPPRVSRRAPLIGEHNQEVYEKELGISREELLILKQAKVI